MTLPSRYYRYVHWAVASTLLFVSALAMAQDGEPMELSETGRSPLESGNALLSVGIGTLYSSFASAWGGELGAEIAVSEVDIGVPLVFGAGALGYFYWLTSEFRYGGTTIKYDHNLWAVGVHGTAHFFVSPSIDIYARLGLYYTAYASPERVAYNGGEVAVPSLEIAAINFLGSFGVNFFVSDRVVIYVEPRLNLLNAGLRLKL